MRRRYLIVIGILAVLLLAALGAFLVFGRGSTASAQTATHSTTTSRTDDDASWLALDHVAGTVTKITNSTISISRFDGTTQTVKVDSKTRYESTDKSASLSNVKKGSQIYADGTIHSDGSLYAERIVIGNSDQDGDFGPSGLGDRGFGDGGFRGFGPGRFEGNAPDKTPLDWND